MNNSSNQGRIWRLMMPLLECSQKRSCNIELLAAFYTEYGSVALKLSLLDISKECVQCAFYHLKDFANLNLFILNILTYQRIKFWLCRYLDSIHLLKRLLNVVPNSLIHYKIEIFINIANSQRAWCNYEDAESSINQAEQLANLLSPSHYNDLLKTNILFLKARLYMDTDRSKHGLDFALDCLQQREMLLPCDHPDIAIAMELVAKINFIQNIVQEAQKYHDQAYKLKIKAFGLHNFETIDSINEKGRLLLSYKKQEQHAMYYFQLIGDISQVLLGPCNQYQALSYNNLGCALFNIGKYDSSIQQHSKALCIYEKLCGQEHAKLVFSLNQMANANKLLNRPKAAFTIWRRCQTILEKNPQVNSKQLSAIKSSLQGLSIQEED
ncbi:unnamed protein product (macronuclear) [Paramecium tetraurelia]|uniref:MalT-like TPR region domain-containing protein n=1 Tax=Paramecium tetraurelia TaxID=5888 RepID=A0DV41_PARTE|nr:uncharacterized protein GSPATT00020570001 [Paramecium tetraurelia]CAK86908.1 unnamed protein product [Paramecium tetraurelia]|eukprot:XP_001454305.1 hypothetical protein (macronuclear) [Paramecium tetraurelia strain d4-2]